MGSMRRFSFIHLVAIFLLMTGFVFPAGRVQADSTVTTSDLINLVNNLRSSYGLPALSVNSILMGTAQATAQTMAASGELCAHR